MIKVKCIFLEHNIFNVIRTLAKAQIYAFLSGTEYALVNTSPLPLWILENWMFNKCMHLLMQGEEVMQNYN